MSIAVSFLFGSYEWPSNRCWCCNMSLLTLYVPYLHILISSHVQIGVQDLCWLYGSSCTNNRILQALRRLFLMQVVEVPWIALIAARAYIKLWWCVNLEDLELGDMGIWSGFFEVYIVFGFSLKKQLHLLVCFCTYFCRHLQLLLRQVEPPSSKKAKFNPFQVHFIDQI